MNFWLKLRSLVTAGLILWPHWSLAWGPYRFQGGASGKAELKYINEVPVLVVAGRPDEIGHRTAELTAAAAKRLLDFPLALVTLMGQGSRWPQLLAMAREMLDQLPADHRRELEAFAQSSGLERDKLLGMNALLDIYGGFGCSSLVLESERSATGSPILGRNLDIFSAGVLQQYGLVVVCRPEGKIAFVSVAFPGVFGVFSGMNERGLALALHGVFRSGNGSANFDPKGTPCTMVLRRVLEECSTVQEAEALLQKSRHTTVLSVVLCDRQRGSVVEVGPGGTAVRRPVNGICACTNHFRAGRNLPAEVCPRYAGLLRATKSGRLTLDAVARKLDEVNQGLQTVQTMIFEPDPLRLHVAVGTCPSSSQPLKALEMEPLLKGESSPGPLRK